MTPLHRHQLVRLTDAGWRQVLERPWDDEARTCLAHWASRGLPLVVTRRTPDAQAANAICAGLAAPALWRRRRIGLCVDRSHVAWFDEFPRIDRLALAMPAGTRARWRQLAQSLAALDATARVYGSHGWELLCGLTCTHGRSDVDVWVAVRDAGHADAVAAVLQNFEGTALPRLDGELVFADGRAVAWREWLAWRSGRCRAILAKSLSGATLVDARAPAAGMPAQAAAW